MIKCCNVILVVLLVLLMAAMGWSLTLNQALKLAQDHYPQLKSQKFQEKATRYLYKSSIDAYLPTLSTNLNYKRTFESSIYSPGEIWDNQYNWDLSLKYRLFDGGYRYSQRKQSLFNWQQSQQEVKVVLNELMAQVKMAFFKALAQKEIVKIRQDAAKIALKNYRLARARFEAGVALRSDVTQAQVRYTNALMAVETAQKDYEIALAELNSLIGWALNKKYPLEGKLYKQPFDLSAEYIETLALKRRPEVKKGELEVKKTEMAIKEYRSEYFPKIDLEFDYNRFDHHPDLTQKEAAGLVVLRYDLFNGPGRYYRVSAQERALKAAQAALDDIKRKVRLEVFTAYKNLKKAYANYQTAKELVKEAKVNYQQTFGEYKVGKGSIIELINAEINLEDSQAAMVNQLLNYNLAIVKLEKAVFAKSLITMR